MKNPSNILIIEDEPKVLDSIANGLTENGYHVIKSRTGEEGLVLILENRPDLLILDLNLPGRSGTDILKTLRNHRLPLAVLILSARDSVEDRVLGLESGADDYLIKPFAFSELLARIRVLLRRDHAKSNIEYRLGNLVVDVVTRNAQRGAHALNLTPREFEILELLLRHQGQPVTRKIIAKELWKVERATSLDNVIDVHIMRLRKKVDFKDEAKLIHTLRGLGFVISENPEAYE